MADELTEDEFGNTLVNGVIVQNADGVPVDNTYGIPVKRSSTNGVSETNMKSDAFAALGGLGNVQDSLNAVKAVMGEKKDPDIALASLLYFAEMGKQASKPGATLLGSAAGAATAPADYFMKESKAERDRKAKIGPLALQLAATLRKQADVKSDFYTNTKTGENISMTQRAFNALPNKGDFIPYKAKGGGDAEERATDTIIELGPKIQNKTATDAETDRYSVAFQKLTKGYTTIVTKDGVDTTVRVPGIDLSGLKSVPIPDNIASGDKILSTKSRDFGTLGTDATFAQRMLFQEGVVREVLDSGYRPNARDVTADNLPDFIGSSLLSPSGQRFYSSSRNFIAAVLRRESGAAISDAEYVNGLKQYFPQVGDTQAVMNDKESLRNNAILGMYRISGDAFSYMYPEAEKFMSSDIKNDKTGEIEKQSIIKPRAYSTYELARTKQGRTQFNDSVIESLDFDGLKSLLARPDFLTRYSEKQQGRITDRIQEIKKVLE